MTHSLEVVRIAAIPCGLCQDFHEHPTASVLGVVVGLVLLAALGFSVWRATR